VTRQPSSTALVVLWIGVFIMPAHPGTWLPRRPIGGVAYELGRAQLPAE